MCYQFIFLLGIVVGFIGMVRDVKSYYGMNIGVGDVFNFVCQMFFWNVYYVWYGFNGFVVVNFFFNKDW